MAGVHVLASRPPWASLARACALVVVMLLIAWLVAGRLSRLVTTAAGIGFVTALAVVELVVLAGLLRIVRRWTTARPRVTVMDRQLVLRLPRRRWWLLDQLETTTIELAALRALRLPSAADAWLQIETAATTVAVPSLFAVSPYALDAAIRAHAPHETWPDPLEEIAPIASWPSSWVRRVMMLIAAALTLAFPALLGFTVDIRFLALSPISFIAAVALIGGALAYAGTVIIDRRGIGRERGGAVGFVAWSELDLASLDVRSDIGGFIKSIELRPEKHARTAKFRVVINRVAGSGFPVAAIVDAARTAALRHR